MRETRLALPANRSTKFHKLIPQSRRGFNGIDECRAWAQYRNAELHSLDGGRI